MTELATTRDTVAEIFDKLSAEGSEEPAAAAPEPAGDVGDTGGAEPQARPERSAAERARDPLGRFAPKGEKDPAAPELKPDADGAAPGDATKPAGAVSPAAAPVLPELKAPQDWRAAAKEKFKDSPREVQEEALRVYAETRKTLDRAAALEKEAGAWREPLAPFEHIFRARGMTAQQGVASLVQTYAALHTAPLPVRAKILAELVRTHFGTDEAALTMLGKELDGGGPAQPAQQPQVLHPEQIRQLARQEWEAAQQENARNAAFKAWNDFAASAEFLEEPGFRQRLAVELQIAMEAKGGGPPTKEDIQAAFDATCQTHPGVSKIVNQRKEAAAAKARASTPAAGSGVKREPAGPAAGSGKAKDTREEVTRQYDRLSRPRV